MTFIITFYLLIVGKIIAASKNDLKLKAFVDYQSLKCYGYLFPPGFCEK